MRLRSCVKQDVQSTDNKTTPTPKTQGALVGGGRKTVRVKGPGIPLVKCLSWKQQESYTHDTSTI